MDEPNSNSGQIETLMIANQPYSQVGNQSACAYPGSESASGASYYTAHGNSSQKDERLLAMGRLNTGRNVRFAPGGPASIPNRWGRKEPNPIAVNRILNR